MFLLVFLGALVTIVMGLSVKGVLAVKKSQYQLTNGEFGVTLALMLLLVIPLTSWVGVQVAIHNQVSFNENWNGWETGAELVPEDCQEDGLMRHYWIETRKEWKDVDEEYTDKNGEKRTRTVRKLVDVDHKIPYTKVEWTFVVHTTLGDVTIADRNLPENPNAYRFRWGVAVPDYPDTGYPEFWLQVRDRINANKPGPVTFRRQYDNYILASQHTILSRYSGAIDRYNKDHLLPAINSRIEHVYLSNRTYFVGVSPSGDWYNAINRFDAALGSTLQGDLHLVIVSTDKVKDKDEYGFALMAYWQSEKNFDKDALSKNAIVVILGTSDGKTVAWARAYTGMPMGNEGMVIDIQNQLPGTALTPQAILGSPYASLNGKGGVTVTNTDGALERIIWGPHAFKRVHMHSNTGQGAGYEYLLRELVPSTGQLIGILVVLTLFAGGAWGLAVYAGPDIYAAIRERLGKRR